MTYTIPDENVVADVLLKIMRAEIMIKSQAELKKLVSMHLNRINPAYRISEKRIRKIAIRNPAIMVEIRYKTTDREVTDLRICPVCGNNMEKLENMTLDGEKIIIGFKCIFCPYWTGKKLRVPIRYIFRLR